jgi:hypothetical protein
LNQQEQQQQQQASFATLNTKQQIVVNNAKPQVIKLQSFQTAPQTATAVPLPGMITALPTQQQHQQQQSQQQTSNHNSKPIIYVSQSPVKNSVNNTAAVVNGNKLLNFKASPTLVHQNGSQANILQINNNLNGNMVSLVGGGCKNGGVGNSPVMLLNELKTAPLDDKSSVFQNGEFVDEKSLMALQQQHQQQQQQQHTFTDQQVLSLVVLTENSNGGVSYLSLVPQN